MRCSFGISLICRGPSERLPELLLAVHGVPQHVPPPAPARVLPQEEFRGAAPSGKTPGARLKVFVPDAKNFLAFS